MFSLKSKILCRPSSSRSRASSQQACRLPRVLHLRLIADNNHSPSLKPENVLIDAKGFLRITDFGLSKSNVKGLKDAFSVCGTPEYLAPEVLLKKGHGKPVDWWSFGCFLYEMLSGLPPFYTQTREELFEKIKFDPPKLPSKLSTSAKDLINALLNKDPEQRLGSGPLGAKEIKSHPWFSGVDWAAYLKMEVKPPFVPKIKGELDVSNFDPVVISEVSFTECNTLGIY